MVGAPVATLHKALNKRRRPSAILHGWGFVGFSGSAFAWKPKPCKRGQLSLFGDLPEDA